MTIKWNLPNAMYNSGVFSVAELRKLIKEKGNLDISTPAVHRLVNGLPTEIKFSTLDAICEALGCRISDVIERQSPTPANRCLQPLVLESGFKPPVKKKKQKEDKISIRDLPPI